MLFPDETRQILEEDNGISQTHPSSAVIVSYTRSATFARVE